MERNVFRIISELGRHFATGDSPYRNEMVPVIDLVTCEEPQRLNQRSRILLFSCHIHYECPGELITQFARMCWRTG